MLTTTQQKILKTAHLISVGLWLSNVITLLFLPTISRNIASGDELYMYNVIYHFIDMFLLTPAAILTLITGLIYSIFPESVTKRSADQVLPPGGVLFTIYRALAAEQAS
jgi:hypothetical protein